MQTNMVYINCPQLWSQQRQIALHLLQAEHASLDSKSLRHGNLVLCLKGSASVVKQVLQLSFKTQPAQTVCLVLWQCLFVPAAELCK